VTRIALFVALMLGAAVATAQPSDDVPVSTRMLAGNGTVGQVSYDFTINYPQIDAQSADFSALNTSFAASARKAASEAVPCSTCGLDRKQEWYYTQDFTVDRPSRRSILITLDAGGFFGGAHPNSNTTCMLVDLRTGREAGPADVFRTGDAWLDVLARWVRTDLKRQFSDNKPGFETALEPKALSDLLRTASIYCWGRERLTLHFNQYVVGPYVSGPFEVEISRALVQPWINPEGPLGE
jgi:hypothetical protein